jgi:hypothetical protein
MISVGCVTRSEAQPTPVQKVDRAVARVPAETCLGLPDKGVFSDLDGQVQLALPAGLAPDRVTARVDRPHDVLVLSIDGFPRKAYPLGAPAIATSSRRSCARSPRAQRRTIATATVSPTRSTC